MFLWECNCPTHALHARQCRALSLSDTALQSKLLELSWHCIMEGLKQLSCIIASVWHRRLPAAVQALPVL